MEKPTRYYSNLQETEVAEVLWGEKVKNSGGNPTKKGDVIIKRDDYSILLECKTKVKPCKSFSIKREWIEDNRKDALANRHDFSGIVINFGGEEQDNHILLSLKDFKNILLLEGE